jgi:hypothetical protein
MASRDERKSASRYERKSWESEAMEPLAKLRWFEELASTVLRGSEALAVDISACRRRFCDLDAVVASSGFLPSVRPAVAACES